MPKATQPHTTPPTTPRVASITPPKPSNEAWARMLAPSFETEEGWARRDPVNKALFAVSGAADQIGGLAEICWALNLAEMTSTRRWAGEAALRHPYGFLAKTLADVAKGLRGCGELHHAEMDREDAAALRASKRGKK